MNQKVILKLLLISSFFFPHQGNAQKKSDATYFAQFIMAQKLRLGDGLPKDTVRAFELCKDCAENGNMPKAMIQIGIMYKKGQGIKKDYNKAFYWFSKSVERGDPRGMTHLGVMYKEGKGVRIDYKKAFQLFKASAELEDPTGLYGAGYCSYKGLGTDQNYVEAVKWFTKGDEKNNSACSFMLGICYRNGFGVERNEEKAMRLIRKAAEDDHHMAKIELTKKYPEVEKNKKEKERDRLRVQNGTVKQAREKEKFRKLPKHNKGFALTGKWSGTRYIYDFSKQYILREDSLFIIFDQTGNHLTGKWYEDGKLLVNFKGTLINGQIVFNNSDFKGGNRYGSSIPMEFTFARFDSLRADNNFLFGNVETFSPKTKEPGRPCYVVVSKEIPLKSVYKDTLLVDKSPNPAEQKEKNKLETDTVILKAVTKEKNQLEKESVLDLFLEKETMFTAYPNPFKNSINISYNLTTENKVALYIYNSEGSIVFQKDYGLQQKGKYTKEVNLNSPPGQYIFRLISGNESYALIIIKQ